MGSGGSINPYTNSNSYRQFKCEYCGSGNTYFGKSCANCGAPSNQTKAITTIFMGEIMQNCSSAAYSPVLNHNYKSINEDKKRQYRHTNNNSGFQDIAMTDALISSIDLGSSASSESDSWASSDYSGGGGDFSGGGASGTW